MSSPPLKTVASDGDAKQGILEDLVGYAINKTPLGVVTTAADMGAKLINQGSHIMIEPLMQKMDDHHKETLQAIEQLGKKPRQTIFDCCGCHVYTQLAGWDGK